MCLTGMPGAGKSTVANLLKEKNFHVVIMGDIIREKALEEKMELNDENLGMLMKNLRYEYGNGIIAKLTLQKIKKLDDFNKCVVIDGIRSYEEFKILKDLDFVKLLAIHASSDTRYNHIKLRDRSDSPSSYEKFLQRDKREIDIGICEAIALSDEVISNNALTISEFRNNVEKIIAKWVTEFRDFEEKGIITI
ncbi:MAG TPA: AAA family ATPase [Candidatus Nitrosocosmicus sp.]|nr:AAA family ATPase [Candidatus Nitrosocosmicus sp.]